jgi:hypothetical protein
MDNWIVLIAVVTIGIYKIAFLTELDLGRGWLRLKFSVPKQQSLAKTKNARK